MNKKRIDLVAGNRKPHSLSYSQALGTVMDSTKSSPQHPVLDNKSSGTHSQSASPSGFIRGSLISHLKLAAKSGLLEECERVQDVVRNSVESLNKILGGTGRLCNIAKEDDNKIKAEHVKSQLEVTCEVSNLRQVGRNKNTVQGPNQGREKRARSYSSSITFHISKKKPAKTNDVPKLAFVEKKEKCGFKHKLLAVYKGWRIRRVLKKEDIKKLTQELKVLRSKLELIKKTKQPGISIINSAYNFKKQQFHILFNSKIKPTAHTKGPTQSLAKKRYESTQCLHKTNPKSIGPKNITEATRNKTKQVRQKTTLSSTKKLVQTSKLEYSDAVLHNDSENKPKPSMNALQILTQLNSLLMKVKTEKLVTTKLDRKEQWERYDQKFNGLIEDLKGAYENMKCLF